MTNPLPLLDRRVATGSRCAPRGGGMGRGPRAATNSRWLADRVTYDEH
jgi:hypothetical protein